MTQNNPICCICGREITVGAPYGAECAHIAGIGLAHARCAKIGKMHGKLLRCEHCDKIIDEPTYGGDVVRTHTGWMHRECYNQWSNMPII